MLQELDHLISVKHDKVNGVLMKLPSKILLPNGQSINFHFIRRERGEPRLKDLMRLLVNQVMTYCLTRDRVAELEPDNAVDLFREARGLFSKPSKLSTSGEFGELMVYLLIESELRAPQVVSKMALKTSRNTNIKGSDGIHVGMTDGNLCIWFAEAKVYEEVRAAVRNALQSIRAFREVKDDQELSQHDFEINLIRNHLDIPPGRLREGILKLLDPYSEEKSSYVPHHACFVGFNWDIEVLDSTDEIAHLTGFISEYLAEKIETRNLESVEMHFFFVPMRDVDEARALFQEELGTI